MKPLIEQLNRTGGAVYLDLTNDPVCFCWCGENHDRLWFHLGDKPHWGPPLVELELDQDSIIHYSPDDGSIDFMITTIKNAPELRPGESMDKIEAQRRIMTREAALEQLGDPPEG